jgi:hypothetical protein
MFYAIITLYFHEESTAISGCSAITYLFNCPVRWG